MTQIHDIRKAFFEEGRDISEISRLFKRDRKTVRRYIQAANFNEVHSPKQNPIPQPKLDPYKQEIDTWLENDKKDRRKQRHTAKRVFNRLTELHEEFNCSYRTVAAYVKEKKKELYKPIEGCLPLEHKPGEAQVDFGGADFWENGRWTEGHYLNVSFPSSNAGYLQLFRGENQECLFEGLTTIFKALGGVPNRLWFDNASTMVSQVLKNGGRNLTDAFLRFAQHHGFSYAFCNPAAGREKGNVENKVGYHRRNMLVPVPEFRDLKTYNLQLLEDALKDHDRSHYRFEKNISELHDEDKRHLLPLPAVEFDSSRYETVKIDSYGKFRLQTIHTYSASPKYAGHRLLVKITANQVIPLDESHRPITVHNRLYGHSKQEQMDWIPYLTAISRAPGALKYSGIYRLLPDPLQTYLDVLSKKEQGRILGVIAHLSEKDGFEIAVKSVSEAILRGIKDIDSLITLHAYLHQSAQPEKMDIAEMSLPKLPQFSFSASMYDGMLASGRVER